jgi:hypothetical protein
MTEDNNLNPWFEAKRLLIADYEDGYILNDMDADQVHGMREEYWAVRPDRFFPNFNRLKKNGFKSTTAKKKETTTNNKKNATNKKKGEVNAWSIAKPLAHDDYLQGKITDDTDLDRVHGMRDEFKAVEIQQFKKKMGKLIESIKKKKANEKKPNPWYIAKPLAHEDYIAGKITDDMDLEIVHKMRDEFEAVDLRRFKDNLGRLIKRIKKDQARADIEHAGYVHDMKIYKLAKDIDGEWHGSKAERLLKEDVENGRHKTCKPRELRLSHRAYQEFDLDTFRKHIWQETRSKVETGYWLVKKRKSQKKKEAKLHGRKYKEDDNDFFDPVLKFNTLETWEF